MNLQLKMSHYLVAAIAAVLFLTMLAVFIPEPAIAQGLTPPPKTTQRYTGSIETNPIMDWIEFFVNVLSVIIVAGAAVMIAVAGVQYTASRDNAQSVQAAKEKIWNTLLGLVAYFFLYGFVQWLIPGGVF